MRAAGAAAADATLDPICGMEVEEGKARAQGLASEHGGTTWFFCAPACKQAFDRDPRKASARAQGLMEPMGEGPRAAVAPSKKAFHMEDPICGMDVDPDEATRAGLVTNFQGAPFFFCSTACKQAFDANPRAAVTRPPGERAMPPATEAAMQHEGGHGGASPPLPGTMPSGAPQPQQTPGQMPAGGHTEDHGTAAGGATKEVDPVCRMEVDPAMARTEGLFTELKGTTWFFCTPACKQEFDADPSAHLPVVR
jgi:YHS domain-containing protein